MERSRQMATMAPDLTADWGAALDQRAGNAVREAIQFVVGDALAIHRDGGALTVAGDNFGEQGRERYAVAAAVWCPGFWASGWIADCGNCRTHWPSKGAAVLSRLRPPAVPRKYILRVTGMTLMHGMPGGELQCQQCDKHCGQLEILL